MFKSLNGLKRVSRKPSYAQVKTALIEKNTGSTRIKMDRGRIDRKM